MIFMDMCRKLFSLILLITLITFRNSYSQEKDFRTWWALEAEGELFNLIDFSIAPELRLWDNSSRFESLLLETDISAPVTKFFRIGGTYRYQYQRVRLDREKNINRIGIYAEFDTKIERLRMEYRAMYQQEYTNISNTELGDVPESQHRHKVSFRYRGKGWDITPHFSVEMFFTINPAWISYQQKLRITAGAKYRLTKDINLGLAYKFQQEYYEDNPLTSHILQTVIEFEL